MELAQQQAQKQVLSQSLRRSLEVLQLPQTELEGYLQEAVLSNPLLEMELPQDARLPDPEQEPARAMAERESDTWESSDSESAAVWDLPAAWEGSAGEDFAARLADPRAQGENLTDALAEQLLHMPRLTDGMRRLCVYLIECLNENGFLEFDLADLAREQGVPLFDMEQALYIVQDLQPAGVGARSLTECLVLQLARTDHFNPHTLRLVQPDGLERLAKGDVGAIARLLDCGQADARQAAAAVRALNPRPAQGYGTGGALACQIPEAVFRLEDGRVRIELNARLARRLALDERNCALLQTADRRRPDGAAAVYLHQWLTPHPDAGDSIYVTSIPGCKAYGFGPSASAAATFGGTVGSGLSHDVPPILAPDGCAVYTRGGLLIGISSGGRVYGPSYFGYALKHLLE